MSERPAPYEPRPCAFGKTRWCGGMTGSNRLGLCDECYAHLPTAEKQPHATPATVLAWEQSRYGGLRRQSDRRSRRIDRRKTDEQDS